MGRVGVVAVIGVVAMTMSMLACGSSSSDVADQEPERAPTYARDVAPIIDRNCVPCHRVGQVAPFPLTTYDEVFRRAGQIAVVTETRFMPPWKPIPGWGRFLDERRLEESELATLQAWVADGAPEGDPSERPDPPQFFEGWQLGEPDLVVSMGEEYEVPADGVDVFRNFVVPVGNDRDRWVRAIDLKFSEPRVVHHATVLVDPGRVGRDLAAQDASGVGFAEMVWGGEIVAPDGHILGWTPGRAPRTVADGTWWRLPAGADLVVETHLLPTGRPEQVEATVALYFTDEPPTRRPLVVWLGSEALDLEPGNADQRIRDAFVLPVDAEILMLYPHAHYLGREVTAQAVLPDGSIEKLLRIEDWDINWQDAYRPVEPPRLPSGTRLELEMRYDNSSDNWANPFDPPQRVRFGPTAEEEMANLWIQVLAVDRAERPLLQQAADRHRLGMQVEGLRALVKTSPEEASYRLALGDLLARAGRLSEAIPQLRAAVDLDPDSIEARNNLGLTLARDGRLAEAVPLLEQARRLDPDSASVRANLGAALRLAGRLAEARSQLRAALERDPAHPSALRDLLALELDAGQVGEAAKWAPRALRAAPDDPEVLFLVATTEGLRGNRTEALARYREILAVLPGHVGTLYNLGLLLAEEGRRDEALVHLAEADRRAPGQPAILSALRRLRQEAAGTG